MLSSSRPWRTCCSEGGTRPFLRSLSVLNSSDQQLQTPGLIVKPNGKEDPPVKKRTKDKEKKKQEKAAAAAQVPTKALPAPAAATRANTPKPNGICFDFT